MALKIGDKAPDFKLLNTEMKEITLSGLAGKNVVVLFFPAAFTGVCTAELCQTRDNIAFYSNLNATVVGISVDLPFSLAKFKEEQKLPFDLLSDFNKTTSQAYDSFYANWILGLNGVAKRSAFVLNGEGNVVYAEVLESAGDMPNFDAVNAALQAI